MIKFKAVFKKKNVFDYHKSLFPSLSIRTEYDLSHGVLGRLIVLKERK